MPNNANIVERIYAHAVTTPASAAIITAEGNITYAQLKILAAHMAGHLQQRGVRPGDVVGVSMAQNAMHIVVLLALAHLGAVSLPLHIAVSATRRALAARQFGVRYVVSGRDEMALPDIPFIGLPSLTQGVGNAPLVDVFWAAADAPLRIAISSGTSGDPKGMLLTHGVTGLRMDQPDHAFSPLARTLPMDLNFIVGFRPALCALGAGAAVVLPVSMAPQDLLRALVGHAVTHTYLSPIQAQNLCDSIVEPGLHCPQLMCMRIGGGDLSPTLLQTLRTKVTPQVFVSYGSTESGVLSYATPEMLARHPDTVGLACPWVQIEIVDTEDHPLPDNTVGMVRIRSPHQVSGYWGNDPRSAYQFRAGWFYPGDLGRRDAQGLIYIEGRVDEQLNIGGQKIHPSDVESVVCAQAGVLDASVFALSQGDGGERLAVAVVLRPNAVLRDIERQVHAQLGPLAPLRYVVRDALPRTLTEKLRGAALSAESQSPPPVPQ